MLTVAAVLGVTAAVVSAILGFAWYVMRETPEEKALRGSPWRKLD